MSHFKKQANPDLLLSAGWTRFEGQVDINGETFVMAGWVNDGVEYPDGPSAALSDHLLPTGAEVTLPPAFTCSDCMEHGTQCCFESVYDISAEQGAGFALPICVACRLRRYRRGCSVVGRNSSTRWHKLEGYHRGVGRWVRSRRALKNEGVRTRGGRFRSRVEKFCEDQELETPRERRMEMGGPEEGGDQLRFDWPIESAHDDGLNLHQQPLALDDPPSFKPTDDAGSLQLPFIIHRADIIGIPIELVRDRFKSAFDPLRTSFRPEYVACYDFVRDVLVEGDNVYLTRSDISRELQQRSVRVEDVLAFVEKHLNLPDLVTDIQAILRSIHCCIDSTRAIASTG